MARSSNTAEKTIQTAWTLLANGIYPSAQNVREKIRQGSMTTINEALKKEFWPAVSQRITQPTLPEPLIELTQQLWQRALETADDSLAAYREEVTERVRVADLERQAALDEGKTLRHDRETQQTAIERLQEENQRLRQERDTARIEAQQRSHELTRQTAALQTAHLLQTQTEERFQAEKTAEEQRALETEQRLTRCYEDQKTARQESEKKWEKQQTAYLTQLDTVRSDLLAARERIATLQTQLDSAKQQRQDIDIKHQVLTARLQQQKLALQQEKKDRLAVVKRVAMLQKENDERAVQITTLTLAQAQTERENRVLTTQLDRLTQRLEPAPKTKPGKRSSDR